MYRLCDPFVCLLCGQRSEIGVHLCPEHELSRSPEFGDRFTWKATKAYMARKTSELANNLGVSFAYAQENYVDQWHLNGVFDYTDTARAFWAHLVELVSGPPEDHEAEPCVDLDELPAFGGVITVNDAKEIGCTLCRFEVTRVLFSVSEDKRHGLPLGSTNEEFVRIGRARIVQKKARELDDMDITSIVNTAMGERR